MEEKDFKEIVCPKCTHFKDITFKDCEIRPCINWNKIISKELYRCFYFERKKDDVQ